MFNANWCDFNTSFPLPSGNALCIYAELTACGYVSLIEYTIFISPDPYILTPIRSAAQLGTLRAVDSRYLVTTVEDIIS